LLGRSPLVFLAAAQAKGADFQASKRLLQRLLDLLSLG
jgi:hypothetical protein